MAAAAKMTDARTRSIELAQARGETPCSWAARTLGWTLDDATGALVSLALAIHSAHSEQVYSVGYRASVDDATCDCPAARYGRPCWHRGLGVLKGLHRGSSFHQGEGLAAGVVRSDGAPGAARDGL